MGPVAGERLTGLKGIAPEPRTEMYDDVLVPVDGSEVAERAVDHALDIAATYGSTVHGLFVIEPVYALDPGTHEVVEAMRSEARRALADIVARAEPRGIRVVTTVREGTPHREILAYAREHGIDLVVMSTHGRTGVRRAALGSVAERVVRLSDAPVLTVRRPRERTG